MNYLIVGDTIIDENIFLKASGISLETPTMKTEYLSSEINFGGAANVAINLAKCENNVTFLTSLSSSKIKDLKKKISNLEIINCFQGKDNLKKRYWINHGDATFKYLQINNTNNEIARSDIDNINLDYFDIIAFSDYRCGLITPNFISKCINTKSKTFASSQISSRKSNYINYKDVDIIVCNEAESKYVKREKDICITKGVNGCSFNGVNYPSLKVENIKNTIGAGDCFYAAFIATGDPQIANEKSALFLSQN